jgi:hypothetical protein
MTWPQHMWQIQGPLDKGRTNLQTFLPEHHHTGPYLAHLTLLSFYNDKEINKNNILTFMTDYGL